MVTEHVFNDVMDLYSYRSAEISHLCTSTYRLINAGCPIFVLDNSTIYLLEYDTKYRHNWS